MAVAADGEQSGRRCAPIRRNRWQAAARFPQPDWSILDLWVARALLAQGKPRGPPQLANLHTVAIDWLPLSACSLAFEVKDVRAGRNLERGHRDNDIALVFLPSRFHSYLDVLWPNLNCTLYSRKACTVVILGNSIYALGYNTTRFSDPAHPARTVAEGSGDSQRLDFG
jgi:hypothetical protein